MAGPFYYSAVGFPGTVSGHQFTVSERPHQPAVAHPIRESNSLRATREIEEQTIRRKRESRPKVRTGCRTCKIRHVKCDETKPNCTRCTSTGRRCDGYDFVRSERSKVVYPVRPQTQKSKRPLPEVFVPPVLAAPFKPFEGTVQERRVFHRFQLKSIPAFAGGAEADFWSKLVVQAAVQERVIRDAVIALGTLHEEFDLEQGKYEQVVGNKHHYEKATVLYGKAIRQLYQRIDQSPGETAKLALIASILFTCFEALRRNNMAAIVHYQAGLRELSRQMQLGKTPFAKSQDCCTSPKKAYLRESPEDDLDTMLRVFARYDIQACTFAKPRAEALELDQVSEPCQTVKPQEMRQYLENLLIAAYQLVKSDLVMYRYWKHSDVSPDMHEKREAGLRVFETRLASVEERISTAASKLDAQPVTESRSLLGLILQVKIAIIMLKTSIDSGPETSFDQFRDDFESMVSRIEQMTETLGFKEAEPLGIDDTPFTMELGIVHPLFFIACKSRDWALRRRAIVQLKKAGKEGVWEGPIMATVAKRVAGLEEQGLQFGDFVPEQARIHAVRQEVQYEERVVRTEMKIAQDKTWKNFTTIREAIAF